MQTIDAAHQGGSQTSSEDAYMIQLHTLNLFAVD